jgi:cyanophycin synthetase
VVRRDGFAVLNADDPLVYAMRERTGADVVLFTTADEGKNTLVEEHLARGGIAACVRNGNFTIRRGRLEIPIAVEREVPLTLNGAARFQRQNILAAIASAYVQGMRYDDIRAGLLSFFPSPSLTPGRLNFIRLRSGGRAIVDYAHNAAAIEGLLDFVKRLPARRRIGVVTVPGDRRDEDLRTAGRLFAALDHVIVRDDHDLRGREPGAVGALVREGLLQGGAKHSQIELIGEELSALERAMAMVGEDDLLLVVAEKVPTTLDAVRAYAAAPN